MSQMTRMLIMSLLVASFAGARADWMPLASVDALDVAFSERLDSPATYAQTVFDQAGSFPEGDLFPIVFPLLAFVNKAMADPASAEKWRGPVATLSGMAIDVLEARMGRPIEQIGDANGEATYIGQVNLALSAYRLIGGDDRC